MLDQICRLPLARGLSWGTPTLDCFAGNEAGQHQVDLFYSNYRCPKVVAINAMYQPWAEDALRAGGTPLLWIFPPFDLVPSVINKLLLERVDAILVLPKFSRFWQTLLLQLPCLAKYEVPYRNRVYTIGSMAPKNMREHKPPLIAYRASFSNV